jgi:hypothetical protein
MNGLRMPAAVSAPAAFESVVDVVRLAQLVDLELLSLQRGEPVEAVRLLTPVWCAVFATEAMPHAVVSRWSGVDTDTQVPSVNDLRLQVVARVLRAMLLGAHGELAGLHELVARSGRSTVEFLVRVLSMAAPVLEVPLAEMVPLLLVVNRQHSSLLPALVAALAVSQGVGRGASGQPTGDAGGELAGMVEQFLRRCPRSGHEPWLRDLVKGDEVGNPVNSGWLVEADWWILARLSSVLPPTGAQLTLDFHGSTDDARDHSAIMRRALFRTSSVPRLSQLELLRRLRSHPLRDGSLQIQRCEPAWVEAGEAAAARG